MNMLLWLALIIQLLGINLCNWYNIYTNLVPVAGIIVGGFDVCMCCMVNERFDKDKFAVIFGAILSFSAAGTVISDYLLYTVIYEKSLNMRWYGAWSVELFTFSSCTAFVGLIAFKIGRIYNAEYQKKIVNHSLQIIFAPKLLTKEIGQHFIKGSLSTANLDNENENLASRSVKSS